MPDLKMKRSALAMAAVLAAGCAALEPPLPSPDPATPARWSAPWPADATADAGLPARAAADIGWRDFFQDGKLQTLIARALANNRDLRVAVSNVEKARAQHLIQRSERLPRLGANATADRIGGDGLSSDSYSAGVGVTGYELDLFGKVRNLTEAASQQYLAQEAARRAVQLALIGEIATAYLALATDRELLGFSQATLKNYQDSYALTEKRFSLGAVSGLELEQIRTQVESARADVARYQGRIALDGNALDLLVGAPVEPALWPAGLNDPGVKLLAPPVGLPSETLLRRPDIRAAEHRLRAANANIGVARAAYFPSVSLTGSLGSASAELTDLFGGGTLLWRFMPQVNVPIFQGERLRANVDSAVADRDIALSQYEKAIQTGFREVADTLALTGALARQHEAQSALVDAATRAEQLSRARYRAGRDSYLLLLDAQRTLYAAQQSMLATRYSEQSNRIALYKALGGGWKEQSR
ncbi:MAG: efflux transporter outer membrane subunit [Candidatus Competibacteraceae bacterium]|nr:efflux transporter outer membrane subunit [Candidatus Competibacteraceae bacterium]